MRGSVWRAQARVITTMVGGCVGPTGQLGEDKDEAQPLEHGARYTGEVDAPAT